MKNNKNLVEAVATVMTKQVELSLVAPKVEAVYGKILSGYNFTSTSRISKGEKITDYNKLYLTKENTDAYYSEVNVALKEADLMNGIKDGFCPKLVIEEDIRKAKQTIVDIVRKEFGMPEIWKTEVREKIVDLTLKFIV